MHSLFYSDDRSAAAATHGRVAVYEAYTKIPVESDSYYPFKPQDKCGHYRPAVLKMVASDDTVIGALRNYAE